MGGVPLRDSHSLPLLVWLGISQPPHTTSHTNEGEEGGPSSSHCCCPNATNALWRYFRPVTWEPASDCIHTNTT
ncbi:hypothetical protein BDV24DRAFT_141895 [Aspergillus arachidicola]|uniref:Uncharacterized protein n=1 Tax=Aspergillus arachidicola TaxID=656916 RepID=A0A5N6XTI5_9EURO|nr:hypothetical protein BDV24DRAFT_141895 [Aspergillus arachidicola]